MRKVLAERAAAAGVGGCTRAHCPPTIVVTGPGAVEHRVPDTDPEQDALGKAVRALINRGG